MKKRILTLSLCLNILLLMLSLVAIHKLGGMPWIESKVVNTFSPSKIIDTKLSHYYDRKTLFESLNIKPNSIIFVGDSIIEGCNWNELFQSNNIVNRGIGGDTTDGVLERIKTVTNGQPSKIFLMIGINDIGNNVDTNTTISNYKKIIESIRQQSPKSIIFLQNILPSSPNYGGEGSRTSKNIDSLNSEIRSLSDEYKLTYIDLNHLFKSSDENLDAKYTNDGVHLNGNGYSVWKNAIEKYVD